VTYHVIAREKAASVRQAAPPASRDRRSRLAPGASARCRGYPRGRRRCFAGPSGGPCFRETSVTASAISSKGRCRWSSACRRLAWARQAGSPVTVPAAARMAASAARRSAAPVRPGGRRLQLCLALPGDDERDAVGVLVQGPARLNGSIPRVDEQLNPRLGGRVLPRDPITGSAVRPLSQARKVQARKAFAECQGTARFTLDASERPG
jgi:hypothetical protein